MRKEFEEYFLKIVKGNMVKAKKGDQMPLGKPVMKHTWFFADRIKSDVGVDIEEHEPVDFQKKMEDSQKKFAQRKNNRILRLVDAMVRCPYFLCTKEGIAPGTLETTVYYLIMALCRVSVQLLPFFLMCDITDIADIHDIDCMHGEGTCAPPGEQPRDSLQP